MVMESVADALVAMVNEKIAKLKVGQPEDNADITAVVSASSADFIQVCSRLLRVAPCCVGVGAAHVYSREFRRSVHAKLRRGLSARVQGLVEDAEAKGAKLQQEWKREQNLIWPMLVDHVTEHMRLAWEEPFGPVVPVVCGPISP
jgi:glyceraldehyde-3-phosphate dehydrogenase (NADP+)